MHKIKIGQAEFTYRRVDSPDVLDKVFRLRYQVYCKECGFLKEEDCHEGIERDRYDPYSVHFVAEDAVGIVGTVRLVMDSPVGFPFEAHCKGNLTLNTHDLPRKEYAEISRLVISRHYRRRAGGGLFYALDFHDDASASDLSDIDKCVVTPITFGIYREMYRECKRRGITHWFAIMEISLWKLLCMHGFAFRPIGEEFNLYGKVRPYMANIAELEKALYLKSPKFAETFLQPEEACAKIQ